MDDTSVPITIDDLKQLRDFKFTRCDYFTVECDMPSLGWTFELEGRQIPLFMAGGSGIIFRPSPDEARFTSPDQIEKLFHAIEEDPELSVGTGDVWIPNELVEPILSQHELPPRGVTFRIGCAFFIAAMQFRTGRIGQTSFEKLARQSREAVTFSADEHEAFKAWRGMQVELARQQYPKRKDLELTWKDDSSAPEGKGGADR
ncbi:MAG: hypothetical protein JW741_24010 [Sedimentisphaerales bacterium]|nr:hypothetical protein [Sedimentisphaerales bacterium]